MDLMFGEIYNGDNHCKFLIHSGNKGELSKMTFVMMKGEMSCTVNTNLQEIMMEDLHIEVNGKIEAMEGISGSMAILGI